MKKFLICCLSILLFAACDTSKPKKVKTQEFTFKKEGELVIKKVDGTDLDMLDIEIAETPYERETGLMYRESMGQNQGMLFVFDTEFPRSFYMKNTLIPLDIIYLDADKKIVSFQKNTTPLLDDGLPSEYPAMYVLEVNAGLADAWGLKVGDSISFIKK